MAASLHPAEASRMPSAGAAAKAPALKISSKIILVIATVYFMATFLKTALAVLVLAISGDARITRLVVEHTATAGHDGYQKLTGHAYGELDPRLPLNAIITDLEFAPRNARGMVEYVATFTIIAPSDLAKASGVLFYFVPNRGRINLTGGGLAANARRQGHVLVASGWQGDLAVADGMETLVVPVAK